MWQEPQDLISSTERGRTDLTTFYSMEKCSHVCQLHETSLLLHFRAAGTSFGQHCLGATRAALCSGHSEQHSLQQDGRMDMAVVQLAFILLSSNPRVVTPTAMHLNGSKLPNSCFQCCKLNLKSLQINSNKLYKRKQLQPWHGALSCEDTMKKEIWQKKRTVH